MRLIQRAMYACALVIAFLVGFAIASLAVGWLTSNTPISWLDDSRFAASIAALAGGLPAAYLCYRMAKRTRFDLGLK